MCKADSGAEGKGGRAGRRKKEVIDLFKKRQASRQDIHSVS